MGVIQTGDVGFRAVQSGECSHIPSPSRTALGFHSQLFLPCPIPALDAVSPCGFAVLISQRLGVSNETLGEKPRGGGGSFLFPVGFDVSRLMLLFPCVMSVLR